MKKKAHEPYNKLKGFLVEKQLTYLDVANTLNISITAVMNKINGTSDFYVSEIKKLQSKYGVKLDIFFE